MRVLRGDARGDNWRIAAEIVHRVRVIVRAATVLDQETAAAERLDPHPAPVFDHEEAPAAGEALDMRAGSLGLPDRFAGWKVDRLIGPARRLDGKRGPQSAERDQLGSRRQLKRRGRPT